MYQDFDQICSLDCTSGSVYTGLLINLVSSVSIIQINKYIYIHYGYPNMSLTCLHFIFTFIGLTVLAKLGIFRIKKVPIIKMLPMSVSFCGFVVLTNFSLQYNSIGTYQCLKALTTPIVVLISIYYNNVTYSLKVKLTVLPIIMGIYLNSMYDFTFSYQGILIGIVGAIITSIYQVLVGKKQKDLDLNALQLLFYQAPLSALLLIMVIPFFEPLFETNGAFYNSRTLNEIILITLSGAMAFLVNLSIYMVIGSTSVLTYNMVGYFKFILIIAFGILMYKDPLEIEQFFSFIIITLGLVFYSYFRIKETEEEKINTAKKETII